MHNIKTVEGKSFNCSDGMTILDSALQKGLIFEHSCKTGLCGVCKTTLFEGQVKTNQEPISLTAKEISENKILTCCCEAVSDILIDAVGLEMFQGIETKVFPVRINSLKKLSEDIIQVVLRLPPNASFTFLEGQFIDVMWNGIKRSYSIASNSCQNEIMLYVKCVPQGMMSKYWFNEAKDNDLLRIEGPKGTFVLRDAVDKPIIFLATGTGIAPIKSILDKMDASEGFAQSIYLFWGNRSSEDYIWQGEFNNISVIQRNVLSKPDEQWMGDTGYIQDFVKQTVVEDISECQVYACGSNEMILAAKEKMRTLGLDEKQFYSDAFLQSY